ncbi:MAG TPA: nuclear transport factor 2 family protein [Streptosporangiaceae bacterium]|nr:nuclear transport factor 2 family protein [Streptosporangiaceae bacterium]
MADTQGLSVPDRLRRLEDRAEIRQLIQDYRRVLDARDLTAYGLLFAADGEWLGGTGYGRSPAGITAMLAERLPGNRSDSGQASWHLVTEPEIVLHGDQATGDVTWALVARDDSDAPTLRLLGHYQDTYVRENGRWRIQRRVAYTDIPYRDLDVPAEWAAQRAGLRAAGEPAAGDTAGEPAAGDTAGEPAAGDTADEHDSRLRRLEDLEAIRQLFLDYKRVLDGKDFGGYASLFADDGEFVAIAGGARGRAEIEAMVAAMPGTDLLGAKVGDDFHLILNPEIQLDAENADRARAQSTWAYVVKGDDGEPVLAKLGHYDDELVRERGAWRFLRREAPMDIPAPEA